MFVGTRLPLYFIYRQLFIRCLKPFMDDVIGYVQEDSPNLDLVLDMKDLLCRNDKADKNLKINDCSHLFS